MPHPLLNARVRFGALVLCLGLGFAAAPGFTALAAPAKARAKGKKAPPKTKNSALSAALDEKGAAIKQCAIDHALEKGAQKVDVDVRVTINKQGAVVDKQVTVKVAGGDDSKVKACVENAVQSAKFPQVPTPLATAERTWSVAAQ
jgi:hypothetical protein